jgi:FkbM family methyltransferase
VLGRFPPWKGQADGRFVYDFLGVRTDPRFRPQFRAQPAGALRTDYPRPQYDYFELIFILESIVALGSGGLTVMELGAGYGRWLVAAHHAARTISLEPVRLIGVEMVPRHFDWMHEHLRNNGIDPGEHRLIHAAVSDLDGGAWYRPEADTDTAYGSHLSGRATQTDPRKGDMEKVPCIGLAGLLRSVGNVDLIHCDIQGEELRALGGSLDELCRRVRYLVVATHSRRIHRRLRALLTSSGWECRYDFGVRKRERTPFGDVRFLDGLLACVNRNL